jgi:hypothetical protein
MTYFSNLRFFDKSGTPANFLYDPATDMWTGNLYFPRVSNGLYENQHIFILEQVQAGSGTDVTFPVLSIQSSPAKEDWKTRWETDESQEQIFTYVIVPDDQGNPFIQDYEEIEYANAAVPYTLSSPDGMKVISSVNSTPLKINIAFTSKDEDIYERTLIIEDLSFPTPKIVAKINFYGETVGEDERFRLVLENFGRTFNHQDELMLANSDIKEPLPNWINTNDKRKELLLAGEDIYPYVGAYKGLINVVKFFGYQTLRIKEYWLNIASGTENFGKMQQFELTGLFTDEFDPTKRNPLVPSTSYKKTSMFGLFYDITVETGDFDEFGTPITTNAFMFTNEEVLIKLFALKQKLTDEFLPLNAKIVDIVGEGIYFQRYEVKTWTDPTENFEANLADNIDFTTNIEVGYIRDLRKFNTKRFDGGMDLPLERFTNTVNPYSYGQAYPVGTLQGLIDSIKTFYTELSTFEYPYNPENTKEFGDEPGIVAGCPIIFQATVDAFTWDDMDMKWDDLSSPMYTWDTIDFSNYYEIEWTIEKDAPNGYFFKFRGPIKDYYILPHFLPYSGKYKVTLRMYDMFNQQAIRISEDHVEVLDRQLEIAAFCRFRNFGEYTWDSTDETWDDLGGSTWEFPIEGMPASGSPVHEKMLNWSRYKNQEDMLVKNETTGLFEELISTTEENAKRVGTRNLTWDNMGDLTWDEMYHSTWNMYDYHGEFLGGFRIFNPGYGDTVQIDDYDPFVFAEPSPAGPLTLQEAADQLNASTNPGISRFTYVVRFQDPLNNDVIIPYGTTVNVAFGDTYKVSGSLIINGTLNNDGLVIVQENLIIGGTGIFLNAGTFLNAPVQNAQFIHACAKFPGGYGWCFISYVDNNSPGIYGDPYSFRKPTWLDIISVDAQADAIDSSQTPPITVDRDIMFLDVPIEDLIKMETEPLTMPRPDQLAYWEQHGFKKTEAPTYDIPYGERRGELPSWSGTGAFTSHDLRIFKDQFECPLGVPLFIVNNHSEIPGKNNVDTRWVVTNSLTGQKIIETKGKPFLIINLIEESFYDVECWVTDSNNNESYTKKQGFVKVASRANMGQPGNIKLA